MTTWRRVSLSAPCAICGKPDWCSISADGIWALCRRVDTGAGVHKRDKAGAEYALYRLDGHAPYQQPSLALPSPPCAPRAEPVVLDRVSRALLALLALSAEHRRALRQRGLSDAEILRRRYRTLPLDGRAALAKHLVAQCGAEICAQIPGFYLEARNDRRWWTLAGAPGLLIPVRDIDGRIVALKVRADDPGEGSKYTYLSSTKYGGPGPGAQVHVPLHSGPHGATVRVTEGEIKGDVATALSGVLTIAVPGVAVWRQALPVLQALQPARVLLSFDADWRQNPHVARALSQAAMALAEVGHTVVIEVWDASQGKGIDDLFAAGYTPAQQSVALAFGASLHARARVWTGTLATRAAEEVGPWH